MEIQPKFHNKILIKIRSKKMELEQITLGHRPVSTKIIIKKYNQSKKLCNLFG
jgi:hypothetical protein